MEDFEAYKICDFKPAFGKLFEDYLSEYDFWGYSDIDLILGDLTKVLNPATLANFDILYGYSDFASGPFAIYRNTDHINLLFKKIPDYVRVLSDHEYQGLDEFRTLQNQQGFSWLKLFWYIVYSLKQVFSVNFGMLIHRMEFRHHFQFFYKDRLSRLPADITDVVKDSAKVGNIKALFKHFIISDAEFSRLGKKNWSAKYKNGKFIHGQKRNEMLIFHFRESKKNNGFVIDTLEEGNEEFFISPKGISTNPFTGETGI